MYYNDTGPFDPTKPNVIRNRNMDVDENIWLDENQTTYLRSGSTTVGALPDYVPTIDNLKIKPESIIYYPYYKDEFLNRCSNAYLFDDVVNSAINRLSYFTLGTSDEIRAVLYPESIRPLQSELEARNALRALNVVKSAIDIAGSVINNQLSDQEIDAFETSIHYTDKICKLGRFLRKNYIASHVFGRSASYIEYSPTEIPALNLRGGTPISLKPLKSMLLGNVIIDPDHWNIQAVEYRDSTVTFKEYVDIGVKQQQQQYQSMDTMEPARYLDAQNLLYFVRNNNNMMREENDFFFGHSTIQSIMPLSEESRRLNKTVIPQINQQHWAGSMLWFFPNWSVQDMDKVFQKVKPGGHTGIPSKEITVQQIDMKHDYTGLLNVRAELKKGILTAFGLPSFLMNFEDIQNRSTANTTVVGFNESTIQAERSWITDILEEQWYSKLFRIYWPDDEFIHIKLKMMVEFENITFDTFLEKAIAIVSLYEKKLITLAEGRNMLKLQGLKPEELAALTAATTTNNVPPALVNPQTQPVPETTTALDKIMAQQAAQEKAAAGEPIPTMATMKKEMIAGLS